MKKLIFFTALIFFTVTTTNIFAEVNTDEITSQIKSSLDEQGKSKNEVPMLVQQPTSSTSSEKLLDEMISRQAELQQQAGVQPVQNNQPSVSRKLTPEELADLVAKQVANSGAPTDEAFLKALKERFPLSSSQIRTFKERADIAQWDNQEQLTVPKPVIGTMTANLEPGSIPSVIKIASGYVTSLVFLDESGQPWPIAGYAVGDKDAFQINWDNRSNIMFIQSNKKYASTNLVLQMANLNIPVLFTVVADQSEVFYRLDLRIPRQGPNSETSGVLLSSNASLPHGTNNLTMTNLLDNIPPANSKKLSVEGGEASAWQLDDHLFLRTKLTVLSPKWGAVVSSSDGMHVYDMQSTPVVLASQNGKTVQLTMKEQ